MDTYLDDVVRSLKEKGLTDEAEEIEIHDDGQWKPILEDQKVRLRYGAVWYGMVWHSLCLYRFGLGL